MNRAAQKLRYGPVRAEICRYRRLTRALMRLQPAAHEALSISKRDGPFWRWFKLLYIPGGEGKRILRVLCSMMQVKARRSFDKPKCKTCARMINARKLLFYWPDKPVRSATSYSTIIIIYNMISQHLNRSAPRYALYLIINPSQHLLAAFRSVKRKNMSLL